MRTSVSITQRVFLFVFPSFYIVLKFAVVIRIKILSGEKSLKKKRKKKESLNNREEKTMTVGPLIFVSPGIAVEFANVLNMTETRVPQQARTTRHQKPIIMVAKKIYKPLFTKCRTNIRKITKETDSAKLLERKNWLILTLIVYNRVSK